MLLDVRITPLPAKLVLKPYPPMVKMRKELYILMYDIAKTHRDEAIKMDGNNQNEEIKHSMICILFCYTCLEAFINTIGKDNFGKNWDTLEKSGTTERKWKAVSNELSTVKHGKPYSIFNKDKEPFKSFLKLEKIREDDLVHRKAYFSETVKTKYGNTEGMINVINAQTAIWACETVHSMVAELTANVDNPPSIEWAKLN